MNICKDGGPAFPAMHKLEMVKNAGLTNEQKETVYLDNSGMTLRDYFAAQALSALVTSKDYLIGMDQPSKYKQLAQEAYRYADQMVERRIL